MVSKSRNAKAAAATAAFLAALALGLALMVRYRVPLPSADLSYFHAVAAGSGTPLSVYDASLQAKAVAASRHAPIAEVRRLLDGYTVPCGRMDSAAACVDHAALNRRLDADWPIR